METIHIGSNDYEIDYKVPLGFGKFGNIYKIIKKKDKKEYVLKRLKKVDPNDPNSEGTEEDYFKAERDFLKNVKGPNIIKMEEWSEDENFYYFVLEKMEGDLQQMLDTKYKKGMPSNMIKKIFSQINSGLKIMIDKGLCHRDLKPQNILYSYTNKEKTDFIIKICDFGLITDLEKTQINKTNAGTFIYKAPEIETGTYNNKCDLYSLGIILYMLKTREYIFEGKTLIERLKNQENKIKKKTDDELLNDLIEKLVVYERKDRINWDDYFAHPFFKDNENKSKIKYKLKIIKFLLNNKINISKIILIIF